MWYLQSAFNPYYYDKCSLSDTCFKCISIIHLWITVGFLSKKHNIQATEP
jgi:hypothetical protein